MGQLTDLQRNRRSMSTISRVVVVALAVAFYLALVPVAMIFSGPIYRAVKCQLGDCTKPGTDVDVYLRSRGSLRVGSAIRLPSGEVIGEVSRFLVTENEAYTMARAHIDPAYGHLLVSPLRCQVTANINLELDSDIVVSTCPGIDLSAAGDRPGLLICGSVDHFERMGQEVRRFVLENVRPGEQPSSIRLSGPCGADNEVASRQVRSMLDR